MKNLRIAALALLSAVICTLTSCLGSDEYDYSSYDDVAITSVTLGQLNRYYYKTTTSGKDSLVKTTFSGSSYSIHVDLVKGEIYNLDSLPKGTDLKHVLLSVGTKNSAIATIKNINNDTTYTFSSSDSLDLSVERKLRVYSYNGKASREFTIRISAHQEDADTFRWAQQPNITAFEQYSKVKSFASGDSIYLVASNNSNTDIYAAPSGKDELVWAKVTTPTSLSADAQAIGNEGNKYIFDPATKMLYSCVNKTWANASATSVAALAGILNGTIYAISVEGKMISSNDNGNTWSEEKTDDSINNLPQTDIVSTNTKLKTDNSISRITVIGNRSVTSYPNDTTAVVWSKMFDPSVSTVEQEPFIYQPFDVYSKYCLPRLENLSISQYANYIVAFGGKGIGACTKTAYNSLYFSGDQGLTWKKDDRFAIPSQLAGTSVTMLGDGKYLWLIAAGTGQVWRGKLNNAGWVTDQKLFR